MLKSGRDFIYTLRRGTSKLHRRTLLLLTVTTIVASIVQKFDVTPDDATLPADADIPLRYSRHHVLPGGNQHEAATQERRRRARDRATPRRRREVSET